MQQIYVILKTIMNAKNSLKPLLKYPGGKTSELKLILKNAPKYIDNYIEPFVGGGAVYFAIKAKNYYINDISKELMLLYEYVKTCSRAFFKELDIIIENWNKLSELLQDNCLTNIFFKFREKINYDIITEVSNFIEYVFLDRPMFNVRNDVLFKNYLKKCLISKLKLMKKNEEKKKKLLDTVGIKNNIEAGIKAAYYTYLRDFYNKPKEFNKLSEQRKVAIYFFIREYCYSSMFRFNRKGEFNVPYGGISYNKKTLENKKNYFKDWNLRNYLKSTVTYKLDFYDFVKQITIKKNDFMFLDPPYDTIFSEYDKNEFNLNDQKRLANYLINECPCNFLLIIKKTAFIENLYKNKGLDITENNKSYFVSFKNRNEKEVVHLIITNYKKGEKYEQQCIF